MKFVRYFYYWSFLCGVLFSGCVSLSELREKRDADMEEKQNLQETVKSLERENEKLEQELQNVKLELSKEKERVETLLDGNENLMKEKSLLEEKLVSSRNYQKKLEEQVMESDARLSQIIKKEKVKWGELESVKKELLSRLASLGDVTVTERGEAISVILENSLSLSSGKVEIKKEALPLLNEFANILTVNGNLKLLIEGHTDDIPTKRIYSSNWELSCARALAILHFLEGKGIAPERMSAVGKGEYMPRASNSTAEGRRKNRRVEVLVSAVSEIENLDTN